MKKLFIFLGLLVILLLGIFFWKEIHSSIQNKKLTTVTLALDWTPNTNHTGVYVAKALGWYKQQGINLVILPYASSVSSDVLVASGKADVGVSATEGVVDDSAAGNPVVSIAAIVQHNTSGFIALANNGITSPKDFDGKLYGGSGAPLETAIVGAIIKKDGGNGIFKNVSLDVDAMQALETKRVDFVWVFEGWEVIQAKMQGFHVVYFPSLSYGIPDYYTPVFITSPKEIAQKKEILKKFMAATSKGYVYAISHPKQAAQMLINGNPKGTFPDAKFILASQYFLSSHYVDKGRAWGLQDKTFWQKYPQFMLDSNAAVDSTGKLVKQLDFDTLYTNQFIQ